MKRPYTPPQFRILDSTKINIAKRRSQRVVLQMAVTVRTQGPNGNQRQAQAFTLVVNAHGGLLESPLGMTVDQKIALVNSGTGEEAWCRVVRVEQPSIGKVMVAFEFLEPTARFWPISFPPDDWGAFSS